VAAVAATPVPEREMAGTELEAAMVILAVIAPVAVGANSTSMSQLDPAATLVPQLFVELNWLAFVPARAMLVIDTAVLPELVKVALWGEEVVFTVSLPKLKDVEERVTVDPVVVS
jgi:glucose-6-phosphate dehydrogenase assembly protein OpcA